MSSFRNTLVQWNLQTPKVTRLYQELIEASTVEEISRLTRMLEPLLQKSSDLYLELKHPSHRGKGEFAAVVTAEINRLNELYELATARIESLQNIDPPLESPTARLYREAFIKGKKQIQSSLEKELALRQYDAIAVDAGVLPVVGNPLFALPVKQVRILMLSANVGRKDQLRLGKESREIEKHLRLSEFGSHYLFADRPAVQVKDLTYHLGAFKPHMLHFAGHGESDGIYFLDDNDNPHLFDPSRFDNLSTVKLRMVFLNVCDSAEAARLLAERIPFVIGMDGRISDDGAIEFSRSFYGALASLHRDPAQVQNAFKQAREILRHSSKREEYLVPVLYS